MDSFFDSGIVLSGCSSLCLSLFLRCELLLDKAFAVLLGKFLRIHGLSTRRFSLLLLLLSFILCLGLGLSLRLGFRLNLWLALRSYCFALSSGCLPFSLSCLALGHIGLNFRLCVTFWRSFSLSFRCNLCSSGFLNFLLTFFRRI